MKYDWLDGSRDRKVPVKIYYPKSAAGKLPIIIFSHGLGGSRDGYEYLGHFWASHGYVSVHVQHLGSDSAVWQGLPLEEIMPALKKSILNLENAANRPLDVSFAIDQMEKMNGDDSPLKGRLDLERIGVAGHSFGAFTTMALAGEVFILPDGSEKWHPDPRIKAAIAMSPSPLNQKEDLDRVYAKIKIPIFHMTGTLDDSPIGDTKAADRRVPFDHIHGADQYLVTFTGGDHMIFSGRMMGRGQREHDAAFQKLICAASTAFWDAYLKGDADAKAWLAGNGFESLLKSDGVFEKK